MDTNIIFVKAFELSDTDASADVPGICRSL